MRRGGEAKRGRGSATAAERRRAVRAAAGRGAGGLATATGATTTVAATALALAATLAATWPPWPPPERRRWPPPVDEPDPGVSLCTTLGCRDATCRWSGRCCAAACAGVGAVERPPPPPRGRDLDGEAAGRLRSPGASWTSIGCPGPLTLRRSAGCWRDGSGRARRAAARRSIRVTRCSRCRRAPYDPSGAGRPCARWRVGVDHERHVVDVDAACRDVGRDERGGCPGVERLDVAGAGVLRQVAVQVDAPRRSVELARQRLGAVLGAGEDDRPPGALVRSTRTGTRCSRRGAARGGAWSRSATGPSRPRGSSAGRGSA